MLMIRFQRIGRVNDPAFRIVLIDRERAAKAGNINELLGTYNPKSKAVNLKADRIKYWMSVGAQPTDSIHNLLIRQGVIEGKKRNVLPKKTFVKPEEAVVAEAPAAKTEAPAAAEEVPMPTEAEVVAEAEPAPAEEVAVPAAEETPAA